ncbi:helix-turn-helix domain-containing protein [Xenorhabdus ishibashii]|uniref:Transcription activator PlcR n=1 Tax=Xenorhabdus ishibashii TaxID=1034471 RepID=A0A2D0K854_9GAMM|nr:helix-turn-helix transcriptional regulator [Xenorhabdus ishibashii]PHM59540.1 transcription activator PlcR [Xenorhabdus ishibashii]
MNPQRLIAARKARGITQQQLGEALGENQQNADFAKMRIYRYERGIVVPPYDIVCELAEILDIPECYLYIKDDLFAEQVLILYKNKELRESLLTLLTDKISKIEQYEQIFNTIKNTLSQLK